MANEQDEKHRRPRGVRDGSADRRAVHPEGGEPEVPKDQRVVDSEVHKVHDDADKLRRLRVPRRAKGGRREEDDEEGGDRKEDRRDEGRGEVEDLLRRGERGRDERSEEDSHEHHGDREEDARHEALEEEVLRLPGVLCTDGPRDEGNGAGGDTDHHSGREEDQVHATPQCGDVRDPEATHHDEVDRPREDLEEVRDDHGPCEVEDGPPEEAGRAREESHARPLSRGPAINVSSVKVQVWVPLTTPPRPWLKRSSRAWKKRGKMRWKWRKKRMRRRKREQKLRKQ